MILDSCLASTRQILNLTQYIEDGYKKKNITGIIFINLSATYDMLKHGISLKKIYQHAQEFKFI